MSVKDGIAARNVEIRTASHPVAHVFALSDHLGAFVQGHLDNERVPFGEYVAVLAALVAGVRDMELEGEVLHGEGDF